MVFASQKSTIKTENVYYYTLQPIFYKQFLKTHKMLPNLLTGLIINMCF